MLRALLEQRRKSVENSDSSLVEIPSGKSTGEPTVVQAKPSSAVQRKPSSPVKEVWTTSKTTVKPNNAPSLRETNQMLQASEMMKSKATKTNSLSKLDTRESDRNCSILKALLQKEILPKFEKRKKQIQSTNLDKSESPPALEKPGTATPANIKNIEVLKISNQSSEEVIDDLVDTDLTNLSKAAAIHSPKNDEKEEIIKTVLTKSPTAFEKQEAEEVEKSFLGVLDDTIPNSPRESLPEAPVEKSEVTDEILESRTPQPQLLIPDQIPTAQRETSLPPAEILCSTDNLPERISSRASSSIASSRASSVPPLPRSPKHKLLDRPISADILESPQDTFVPSRIKTKRHSRDFLNEGCEDEIASMGEDTVSTPDTTDQESVATDISTTSLVQCLLDNVKKNGGFKCTIPIVDVFYTTPLDSFLCYGCSQPYGSTNNFTLDLKDGTIDVVCGQCKWWTIRRAVTKDTECSLKPMKKAAAEIAKAPPAV